MNGTNNSTDTDTSDGLTGGSLFLVVLSATSAWCVFIMCIVCCSEYRGYQRRGRGRNYNARRNAAPVENKSYTERKEELSMGVAALSNIQQELSTISPSDEVTDSSIERKDDKTDIFHDQNDFQENNCTLDFPTPKNRKTILPPINVGTIINVESRCHSDTNSPSKEMLLEISPKKHKNSQMTPVIVHS
ncbi:uncharacterized protein LOC134686884 isoform X2 [Mytilus trossulus]|uniref:uncharacterized protein LOC134686884 isoform X2 n=1 Tax=Mytilus trossulus TaxID=6551 RepID=UPI0030045714